MGKFYEHTTRGIIVPLSRLFSSREEPRASAGGAAGLDPSLRSGRQTGAPAEVSCPVARVAGPARHGLLLLPLHHQAQRPVGEAPPPGDAAGWSLVDAGP